MQKRIEWIDLLRILATWGVISIHGKICYSFRLGTIQWFECNLMGVGFLFCVPAFLMLSGYLSLSKEISIRDTVTRRVPRVIFMKIISLVLCALAGGVNALIGMQPIKEGVTNAVTYWGFGTTYLAVLAGCYLVSPFLYKIVENQKFEEYFLILAFIFCFIVPPFVDIESVRNVMPSFAISVIEWIDYGQVYVPVGSAALFVLGHYLGRISDRISKKMSMLFLILGFLAWVIPSLYQAASAEKNIVLSILLYGRYYGSYVAPLITVYTAAIFVFFKVVVSDIHLSERIRAVVGHLGRNSVMIFLLHGIVISLIRPHISAFWTDSFLLETIVEVTVYFVIGYIISLILEHVPVINKVF